MSDTARFNAQHLQAAIVDLDGTMVDTLGDFVHVLNCTLADLQLPAIDAETVSRFVGKGSEHLIQSVLSHVLAQTDSVGASDRAAAMFDQASALYQGHYQANNGRFAEVYGGVVDGLAALKSAGWALACVTNKPHGLAVGLLRAKGLDGYFSHVFGGDTFARKKPDPLPLLEACKALGTTPAQTLAIGDSSNDAQAARAAGCPVVLVTYGYNHGEPIRAVDADGFVESLAQVL